MIDLTPVLHSEADPTMREWLSAYDVTDATPDVLKGTSMDGTQFQALYRMINKELCIVQGPPGTGKTFTSVQALKVMLRNQKKDDPPIIIAAQTNHALDQLLNLCLDAGAGVVRIGGRTDNERIADHSLYKIRQKFSMGHSSMSRALNIDRQRFNQDINGLANTLFNGGFLEPTDLRETGLLTEEQYRSLVDEQYDREGLTDNRDGPFSTWLAGEIIQADNLRDKYSEQDLNGDDEEYNQDEYELEGVDVEHIAADEDDDDRIHGHFVPLAYTWAGKLPAGQQVNWRKLAKKELKNPDLYHVAKHMRGAVYQYLREQYAAALQSKFGQQFKDYNTICKELKAYKWQQDAEMILTLGLNIVGCTTTGLTKYRGLLAALGARTMLVEEAAETREANIVSALYPSIQQLILVGDHQQLAPFSNVKWLGQEPYHLDMSLFERMVDYLGLPYLMLDKQRRMAPEIRAIVDKFYNGLLDHPVALTREPVPGMGDRQSWLFHHTWEDAADANHSRYNLEEADMVVNFFVYLVNNGTKQDKITVLTYYMAQRKKILQRLRQHPSLIAESYNVHTVDSYQGEENDVVLLSMVRSPSASKEHAVGFLDSKNRAIVAISRARRGFYVFGNIENAIKASEQSAAIWGLIYDAFVQQNRVDRNKGLPLQCQPHGKTIWIKHNGWADNAGGCDERCDHVRPCGHRCTLTCHVKPHDKLRCSQACGKVLPCGHTCQIWCKDPCNCLCENFQSAKKQARTRTLAEEARYHLHLETVLKEQDSARRESASRRGLPQRLVPQQVGLQQIVSRPTTAQERLPRQQGPVVAWQNNVPCVFEHGRVEPGQEMPQQRAPYPQPPQTMQRRQQAVARQGISQQVRLQQAMQQQYQASRAQQVTPQQRAPQQALPQFINRQPTVLQDAMPQPAPGPNTRRPFDTRSTMDLEDIMRVEAGMSPRPIQRAPVPTQLQPVRNLSGWGDAVPAMIPPHVMDASTGRAIPEMREPIPSGFQNFADNASTHDRAFAQVQQAMMADSADFQPDILDMYHPVGIINGQRVAVPPDDPFPVIQTGTEEPANTVNLEIHRASSLPFQGSIMDMDDDFETIADGCDALTEHGPNANDDMIDVGDDEYSTNSYSSNNPFGDPPSQAQSAGFQPIHDSDNDRPDHPHRAVWAQAKDLIDMGPDALISLDQLPKKETNDEDVDLWVSSLTLGEAPPSVAGTRPSSSYSAELSSIQATSESSQLHLEDRIARYTDSQFRPHPGK